MVSNNSLGYVSRYHPMLLNGEWVFPINQNEPTKVYIGKLYNFVAIKKDRHKPITVNGNQFCTWGHGLTNNDVIKHDFFGDKIVSTLQTFTNGWNNGRINYDDYNIIGVTRDNNHMINGFKFKTKLNTYN